MQRHVDAIPDSRFGRGWPWAANARFLPGLRAIGALGIPGLRIEEPPPLGKLGNLEIRLARSAKDVRRAQRLRYRVF